jgi:hypothetical protein
VLSYDFGPPAPSPASECRRALLCIQREEKEGEVPIRTGKVVGDPNHTTAEKL